ncbi:MULTISPECIES: hypothetical protein [Bacillus]|uniref:Uncharacterized protein n=1 Tax=Bacillus pseudomycoides TaxID=64104 RepID=A0AAJ2DPD7_9BACI|nr:hypothetical protein [Bacillus pseudomycoides]MCR8859840.1 hypothetical protein [Bacillus pseudomycoides]MDR4328378.1 hypothetical protein [Bacillus pseudomycoides]MED1536865.1 hypothetical protein [Bacillus pseudomycoides]PFY86157.1 hypothetical protein COL53_25480 [Bacillus pseudomycoides]PFZ88429.1 hypothetical protein COL70_20290 [Bacillus pseudomycoides]
MELNTFVVEAVLSNNWLKHCGTESNFPQGIGYTYLSQKKIMIKTMKKLEWENICLEERNNLTGYLAKNEPEIYNKNWNTLVKKIKAEVLPKITDDIEKQILILGLPKEILNPIKFDIVNLIMVLSYEEYYKSAFYNEMLEIYLSGHIPCGWNGKYTEGNIFIY